MAKRSIDDKKRRRVAKALRRTPLPAKFDLVEWLIFKGHAKNKKAAEGLILDRRVLAGDDVVGQGQALSTVMLPNGQVRMSSKRAVDRHLSTDLRDSLRVLSDDEATVQVPVPLEALDADA